MRYEFLKKNRGNYNIERACRILKVSRGGFYEYLKRKPSARQIENEYILSLVKEIFDRHEGRYGALRISLELKEMGIIVNRKRGKTDERECALCIGDKKPLQELPQE